LTGAVLVTTPQAVAAYDVTKAISMFRKVDVPILGIIENMSGFVIEGVVTGGTPGTQVRLAMGGDAVAVTLDAEGRFRTVVDLFGRGGGKQLAQLHGFPFLGEVPIDTEVRTGGDDGTPIVVSAPERASAVALLEIAGRVAQRIAVRSFASLPVLD
jgi:ATP-binding protein involved in chromosome partitioning